MRVQKDNPRAGWAEAVQEIAEAGEDPSLRLKTDQESGQTILSGMGEPHLEIIIDRLRRE